MNKILFFLIVCLLISNRNCCYLKKNEVEKKIGSISKRTGDLENDRNLLQIEDQVSQVLEITRLKQAGFFIYGLGIRLVGMQNLLIWQIVHLYQQSQPLAQQIYFNIGEYINGYSNPGIFAFQGFGYGYLFSKLNLMWEVGIILFCIGSVGRFILGPLFKNRAMDQLEKRLGQKRKQIKIQVALQQHNYTEGQFVTYQPCIIYPNHNDLQEFDNNQPKNSMNAMKQPTLRDKFDHSSSILKGSFIHRDSLIKSKIMGVSCLQTCDGSNIRTKPSNMIKVQSKLMNQIEEQTMSQIGIKKVQLIRKPSKIQQGKIYERNKINIEPGVQIDDHEINHLKSEQNPLNNQSMKDNFRYYKFIQKYSNILLKQIVFNILVNSLAISSYGAVRQIIYPTNEQGSQSLSYSGGFIIISQFLMLFVTLSLVLKRQVGSGQNRSKFKAISYRNLIYWSVSILQRLIYGSVLSIRWKYSIIIIASIKLIVLVLSNLINVWKQSSHYYRYLCSNFIHLLVICILVLDQFYLRLSQKFQYSKISIAWILFSLLILSFLINFCFIVKESALIKWFKNITGNISTTNSNEQKKAQTPNILDQPQQNLSQNLSQSNKHVKFNLQQQIIPVKISKSTQRSLQKSQIRRQLPQKKQQHQKTQTNLLEKAFVFRSESMIRKQRTHLKEKKPTKFSAKTHKDINTEIDDALRAQKTKDIVIQQTNKHDQQDLDQAQIVSIQLNKDEKYRNQYRQLYDKL